MTSIDELFKKPNLPSKRKLEVSHDPSQFYKSAKLAPNGDAKGKSHATVEDEEEDDDQEAGPALPPEEDDYCPEDDEEGRFFGGGVDKSTTAAMEYIDKQDEDNQFVQEKFDTAWVKKMALNFEKKISQNAELRAKYEDQPAKFMGSEADLDADIKALSILSEHPELYEDFAKLGCVSSLVSLLAHENTDIAINAIEIFSELTDEDVDAEQAQWDAFVNAALEADLLSLLISNLQRFDESNEADRGGVYNSLGILESLASQSPIADRVGKEPSVFKWLLDRIQKLESPLTQNKQYAAEVLAILLQSSTTNRDRLCELDGVDILLQLISPYRKRDPQKDSEEEEYVENLFDALVCVAETTAGKIKFVEAEGVELCLIMLREGKMSKPRALRLLDHALGGMVGGVVCEKLVEAAGLKTIFSMFMKKQDSETTEHLLGILAALLRSLPGDSPARIRTLVKFVEKNYEKIGKLIDKRREYVSKVDTVDQQIKKERVGLSKSDVEDRANEWLSRRLDAGLFCLQTVDVLLAWLIAEDSGAKVKIVNSLADREESLKDIRATLQEQLEGIEGDAGEDAQNSKEMLSTLLEYLQ